MTGTLEEQTTSGLRWQTILFVGLSLSIGWGIRGNFGHEYGAMLPGALAAMAAVLISGREDWLRRIAYFGMFGAIGWAFGGSMSYMQVIGYTHSGHSLSVWYGFVCLFILGFVWGAMGGAGTALPAYLTRERLIEFFVPVILIFLAWWGWDILDGKLNAWDSDYRQNDPLYWFDTDWIAALIGLIVTSGYCLFRRRIDKASSLLLHMSIGWWAGFLILTVGLGLRMTPPRGDNWSGMVGLVLGTLLFFQRNNMSDASYVTLVTGFFGGLGFASATLFKLIEVTSGLETNWHSVLEQTYGLINGIGVAVAMGMVMRNAPRVHDEPPTKRWTEGFAVWFVVIALTYLNMQRVPGNDWIKSNVVPQQMYFLTAQGWFDLAYFGITVAFVLLLIEHMRRPLDLIPTSWLGKGQMLYLALLWWMVIGNLFKAVAHFAPERLITEGTIHLNALLVTVMALTWVRTPKRFTVEPITQYRPWIKKTLLIGFTGMALTTLLDWGIVRAIYGNRHDTHANLHIRFGPRATTQEPKKGQKHP